MAITYPNPYTGRVYKYSYFAGGHPQLLTGMPTRPLELGEQTEYRKVRLLEWVLTGKPHIAPMRDPGEGPRTGTGRARMLQY